MTPSQQSQLDKAERRIAAAYARTLFTQPFFASLLYRMQRRADPACDTMWVDGRTLGYNPGFVLDSSSEVLVTALCHETAHVLGKHHLRRGDRDGKGWNVACDHVVNGILTDAGFRIPEDWLEPVSGTTPEKLYRTPEPQPPQPGGGESEPEAEGGSQPEADQQGTGQGGGDGEPEDGDAGDVGFGDKQEEDERAAAAGQQPFGEVRDLRNEDGTPLSEAERDDAEQQVNIAVAQAVRAAQKRGTLPGGLAGFAARVTKRILPWAEVLHRFLDQRSRSDFTWMRPNVRYLSAGQYLPSLNAPAYGSVMLFVDTSGSMGWQQALERACEEVRACLAEYATQGQVPPLTLGWIDTEVHVVTLEDEDDPLAPVGYGGTDYAPAFEYVEREQLEPRAIVYLTDGQCDSFGREPACPVLWILTDFNDSFKPPFGEVICMAERAA